MFYSEMPLDCLNCQHQMESINTARGARNLPVYSMSTVPPAHLRTSEVLSRAICCPNAQIIHISARSPLRNEQLSRFMAWTQNPSIKIHRPEHKHIVEVRQMQVVPPLHTMLWNDGPVRYFGVPESIANLPPLLPVKTPSTGLSDPSVQTWKGVKLLTKRCISNPGWSAGETSRNGRHDHGKGLAGGDILERLDEPPLSYRPPATLPPAPEAVASVVRADLLIVDLLQRAEQVASLGLRCHTHDI